MGYWDLAKAAAKTAWANPAVKRAALGAGIGAAYGAVSNNHSMLGMAALGAGIGGLSYGAGTAFSVGRAMGGAGWKGFSLGAKAVGNKMWRNGAKSVGFLKNSFTKAVNPVASTMKASEAVAEAAVSSGPPISLGSLPGRATGASVAVAQAPAPYKKVRGNNFQAVYNRVMGQ